MELMQLVSLLITFAIAACAYLSLRHWYKVFFHQEAPKVIVYVKEDNLKFGWLMVCVQNIGKGVALDIKFKFDGVQSRHGEALTSGPLIEGISLLAPGQTRDYLWGKYEDLVVSVGTPIEVEYKYSHYVEVKNKDVKVCRTGKSKLDIRSFYGTNISKPPNKTATDHLGSISDSVEKIANKRTEGRQ